MGIREALDSVFPRGKIEVEVKQFDRNRLDGDGCVLFAFWEGGSCIVVWDGRNHIDLNLFTFQESKEFAKKFVLTFTKRKLRGFKKKLHDEQPRGIGRVVNLASDLTTNGSDDSEVSQVSNPHWAL